VSQLGDQFYVVGLPWLVLQKLGSAEILGTVLMAGALPRVVLFLIGGAASDRVSVRWIMLTSAAVRAACVGTIGALAWLGMVSAWEIYALVIVFGIADAFAIPAQIAYVPALLSAEQLVAGFSLTLGTQQVAYALGPIPAGLAVARFGVGPAFVADAVGFLAIIVALLRLPDSPVTPAQASTIGAIREGVAYVLGDVPLRTLMLLAMILGLCITGPVNVGLAYIAASRLASSTAYGVIISAAGAGAVAGTLAGGAWKTRQRGTLIVLNSVVLGVGTMCIPFMPGLWGIVCVVFVMSCTTSLANLHISAWIMQRADATFRGRVSSVLMLASYGLVPVSMAAAGFMITWSATGLFVLAGACVVIAAAAVALLGSLREIE
jgi:hypothetical protein